MSFRVCRITVFFLYFISPVTSANELSNGCSTALQSSEKNEKIWKVNLTGIGVITAWGVANWDYFSQSPKTTSEGWFANETKSGGADKLGHAYTSYVLTHGLSNLYESWCFTKKESAKYGALSSLAIVTYMEIGDSFSDFGASKEDLLANILGITFGYLSYKNSSLTNVLDFRWEYKLNSNTFSDFSTDYENSKYLLALKLNGFDRTRNTFLKHIELHAGYFTRGFEGSDSSINSAKERDLFFGIGFNLTDLFRRRGYSKTATLFKYYQIPGISLQLRNDLNE